MRNRAWVVPLFILSSCGPAPAPSGQAGNPAQRDTAPNLTPPATMSHGEAKIGPAMTAPDRAADAPASSRSRHHKVRFVAVHVRHEVAPGVVYEAWTFDSVVPGPTLRLTVGDTMDFTLVNGAMMPHSMDFHAAEIAPDRAYHNVMPRDSVQFQFVARVPGAFMYHCGTAPVATHIANGMYGAFIIDPRTPRPPAKEFVVVQSEFYMGPPSGADSVRSMDWDKVLNASPDYVVFNGVASRYATHPIPVAPGEPLRMFVVNAGPNRISSFHVVGAIFDKVYADGFGRPFEGMQTWNIPVGGGAIFDFRLVETGLYPFVTHAFADATKGGVGVFRAGEPAGTGTH
ncbi:MAG TPA: multicopper oxidase domain-containing protein [Gemmatimonadales bacterium]|nr:multicopper oxidase domain-containing protein [Gemmatimonadales bacterium]